MTPIVITVSHSLSKDEVLRRLRPAIGQAAQAFPMLTVEQEEWHGDRMEFRVRALGQPVGGNVTVGDTDVRLELQLPWLLARFAASVQRAIAMRGRVLLGKN